MRRALATTALAAGLALGSAPLLTAPAFAGESPTAVVVASATETDTDTDEPGSDDGKDDSGRWGLLGLTGLFGLFGYKKYKEHRAAGRTSARNSGPIGDIDSDGSGSRKV